MKEDGAGRVVVGPRKRNTKLVTRKPRETEGTKAAAAGSLFFLLVLVARSSVVAHKDKREIDVDLNVRD